MCCNIPGPGTDTEDFEDQIQGCSCTGIECDTSHSTSCTVIVDDASHGPSCTGVVCDASVGTSYTGIECDSSRRTSCSCMKYGSSYTADGKINVGTQGIHVFNECNSLCNCSSSCSNRLVQHGMRSKLEVFWNDEKGLALRTLTTIDCGRFVCEYAGEVLTQAEARRRAKKQSENDMNYIFALKEHVISGILTTYIDPCLIGNVGRFINHSCDPNLSIYPVRVNNLVPKVCLFAARDIRANEELTYNYGQNEDTSQSSRDEYKTICKCNADSCSGFLPFDASVLM